MSKKIYGIPVSTPINPAKVNPVVPEEKIASSVAAYMEANPITPSGIGARPDTWTPTAEEVGAAPDSHVEDKNNPHGVTAEQVGARPNTWLPTIAEIGAAPSGYGIGGTVKRVNSLDEVDGAGWYSKWFNSDEMPSGACYGDWPFRTTLYVSPNVFEIEMQVTGDWNDYSNLSALRRKKDGTWQPWEWVNPPMRPGVTYRTTKRYNGKAVYCALMSIGSVDANGFTSFNIQHFGASEIVSCYIKDKHDFNDNLVGGYGFSRGNIAYDVSTVAAFIANGYDHTWSGAILIEYIR